MDNASNTTPVAPLTGDALAAQLEADDRALLAEVETVRAERDSARRDVEELLAGEPRAPRVDFGDDLPATVAALCDVYRITQAGGADRQRFYEAAIRGGELLAARLPPKE